MGAVAAKLRLRNVRPAAPARSASVPGEADSCDPVRTLPAMPPPPNKWTQTNTFSFRSGAD
ncbi:MAG: hypothetical protein EXS38_00005 [Opitutus sp.]|nr:hypothetical protein [Opitutus sp.]